MAEYRKKLIEVALPLMAINEESARRKRKAPKGYPTAIHKWWAQRPIAACRAVIFSQLVDDPGSELRHRRPDGSCDEEAASRKRKELFELIEELVLWDNSNNARVLARARAEIARCVATRLIEVGELSETTPVGSDTPGGRVVAQQLVTMDAPVEAVNHFLREKAPPILDPFCGGGSIPLEAQRLGLRTIASDVNPVPVLITKGITEIPYLFAEQRAVQPATGGAAGQTLSATRVGPAAIAEDIRYYGRLVAESILAKLSKLYPPVQVTPKMAEGRKDLKPFVGQAIPCVAWFWARTVPSPDPSVGGAYVPLVSTFRLRSKGKEKAWLVPKLDKQACTVDFEVCNGQPTKEEWEEATKGSKSPQGASFRCLLSNAPIDSDYLHEQFKNGKSGIQLIAIAAAGRGRSRLYLTANAESIVANCPMPEGAPVEEMDQSSRDLVSGRGFGFHYWRQLFTNRQLSSHVAFVDEIAVVRDTVFQDAVSAGLSGSEQPLSEGGSGAHAYADAIQTYLTFALTRMTDYNSAFSTWIHKDSALRSTLAKQAIPMVWDFVEANPFSKSSAGWSDCVSNVANCVEVLPASAPSTVTQHDSTRCTPTSDAVVVCTDPPYYSNIAYSDLSDFLYVWIRKSLKHAFPLVCSTVLTPKAPELVASAHRHDGDMSKAKQFFEEGLTKAFTAIHEKAVADVPMTVFYAFKQVEEDDSDSDSNGSTESEVASTGWETMLSSLISSGFRISGTWPMRTERDVRQIGIGANALSSSIVLVCRPRSNNAALGSRKEFITALRQELPLALRNLQQGNIAPVDLAQAAIGPGMGVFTRYAKVMESDGSAMSVRTSLAIINQVLDEVLGEQEGDFDGDTRWALSWYSQFGLEAGPFGEAEILSKAKNTSVSGLAEAGIVISRAGKVRLVNRSELKTDWDPRADRRLTVWEITQHLVRVLDTEGEAAAATLVNTLGGMSETARELAYRLYSTSERKKWTDEALAYNGLVIAWPELTKLALSGRSKSEEIQQDLFTTGE